MSFGIKCVRIGALIPKDLTNDSFDERYLLAG